ncbi:glycoside hydrolase family 43 protein [Compostimonas suwonensis]|nr:glycoside hydrolase family 43 protein [Compostimonas suwonensis]
MAMLLPAIPGFYPDPSICRVGESFFIANSTFQYLPGVPVHESTDLRTWRLVANAFSRPEQLDLSGAPSNAGIYAPTIRHRDGRFFVVTSDLLSAREGHLIVHAEEAAGPWSVPVRASGAIGIDPDLFWDEDGTCYLTWKGVSDTGLSGILSSAIDPLTGERRGEVRQLWQGTGVLTDPEGPHLYRRDGFYYCLLAEGGTTRTHSVTIARAKSLDGPWEDCPSNPIFTHRGTASSVQNVGHADLVENADGTWAAVYLGVRPRGFVPKFHVNGRETFVADVRWVEGWPVFDDAREAAVFETDFVDGFNSAELDGRWISHGGAQWSATSPVEEGLSIRPVDRNEYLPALSVRARDEYWNVVAEVTGAGALQVHMDTDNWAEIALADGTASVTLSSVGLRHTLASVPVDATVSALHVSAQEWTPEMGFNSGPDQLVFSVGTADGPVEVARFDGRLLSTEVTAGFTGRVVGVRTLGGSCVLHRFSYEPIAPAGDGDAAENPFKA